MRHTTVDTLRKRAVCAEVVSTYLKASNGVAGSPLPYPKHQVSIASPSPQTMKFSALVVLFAASCALARPNPRERPGTLLLPVPPETRHADSNAPCENARSPAGTRKRSRHPATPTKRHVTAHPAARCPTRSATASLTSARTNWIGIGLSWMLPRLVSERWLAWEAFGR